MAWMFFIRFAVLIQLAAYTAHFISSKKKSNLYIKRAYGRSSAAHAAGTGATTLSIKLMLAQFLINNLWPWQCAPSTVVFCTELDQLIRISGPCNQQRKIFVQYISIKNKVQIPKKKFFLMFKKIIPSVSVNLSGVCLPTNDLSSFVKLPLLLLLWHLFPLPGRDPADCGLVAPPLSGPNLVVITFKY